MYIKIWYLFISFWLTLLCMTVSRFIHISESHNFIPFYAWVIFHYIYVPFIHCSVNGHLGCFYVLAGVNSAAVNTGVHLSFWIMVFSGFMPKNSIARSYCSSIFSFLRNFHAVLQVAVPIYIPIHSVGGLPFLHILSSIYCLWNFLWWTFWPVLGDMSV